MRAASSPALRALPIPTVATGIPPGICTIESSESMPSRYLSGTGTPITGSVVIEATMPGRWAAPPAPAMITFKPRAAASVAYLVISSGMRCADTTCTSYATPRPRSSSAAGFIVGQSESLPMMIPMSGIAVSVREVVGGSRRAGAHLGEVGAECGDVADLAPGTETLAVQMDLDVRPARHAVVHALVDALGHHVVRT